MDYKIEKSLVDAAIGNCNDITYPIMVTGQDYADDLAHALSVINTLLVKVDQLERFIKDN